MAHIKTVKITEEETERLRKLYPEPFKLGQSFLRTDPGNCFFPGAYEKYKEEIYNVKIRPEDAFVLTWPKNGTTWTVELVWLIQNNFDIAQAKALGFRKVNFLDMGVISDFSPDKAPGMTFHDIFARADAAPSPRVMKSHLPLCLLPPNLLDQCKVVVCLRNPKDAVVSYYHHEKLIKFHSYEGTFAEYFDLFMDDMVMYGSYWQYTQDMWKVRDHPNVCLLFYEDMKADLESNLRRVAKFYGKNPSDDEVKAMLEALAFKTMKDTAVPHEQHMKEVAYSKKNKDGTFFRKGEVGDWNNYFTDEMSKRMDEAIEKHFGGTGLKFRYE